MSRGAAQTIIAHQPVPAAKAMRTLFEVRIRHGYYNGNDGVCSDFEIVPTPDCAAFLQSVGMQVRYCRDGFAVHLPNGRRAALASALAARPDARLGFLAIARNPDFIGFTALPIDTCPTRTIFHVSNLETSGLGDWRQLGPAAAITAAALLPVTGARLPVPGNIAGTVNVRDLLGQVVASLDVTPAAPAALSFAGLAYGRYAISAEPAAAYTGPPVVAYMPKAPLALGLIDLVLARPAQTAGATGTTGQFPDLATPGAPPARLSLAFDARPTYWNYFIVAEQKGELSDDLAVAGKALPGGTPVHFTKQQQPLPNGDTAVLFVAREPIPMQQIAEAQFSLKGQRQAPSGRRNDVMVSRLPSAPVAPVWPANNEALAGISEIFVYV